MDIEHVDHIGIRVEDEARALAFYGQLGFELVYRSTEHAVVIVRNAAAVEINFIINATTGNDGRNVLMDEGEKYAGYTHVALRVPSAADAAKELEAMGVAITEGPVALGEHNVSLFIRDLDRNVIELTEVSGLAVPDRGLLIILGHAPAFVIHEPERTLRLGMPLVGGLAIPANGFRVVPRHAITPVIPVPDFVLGPSVPLVGGHTICGSH